MLYILIGPSGSGKSSISREFVEMGIPEIISTTTRDPRGGESHGSPYYFVTEEEFDKKELAEVTTYAGKRYGVTIEELESKMSEHAHCFMIMDRVGVTAMKERYGDKVRAIYVWISPQETVRRLRDRWDKEEVIVNKLEHALTNNEFNNIDIADFCIINKNLAESKRLLRAIVG